MWVLERVVTIASMATSGCSNGGWRRLGALVALASLGREGSRSLFWLFEREGDLLVRGRSLEASCAGGEAMSMDVELLSASLGGRVFPVVPVLGVALVPPAPLAG